MHKPRIAIHKFSSCDGCQLAFLNLGEDLLVLFDLAEVCHFAEAGPVDVDAVVDISFVEGSISSTEELARIERVRERSRYLVTIGACATAGGLQALRNLSAAGEWLASVYATPAFIDTLASTWNSGAARSTAVRCWRRFPRCSPVSCRRRRMIGSAWNASAACTTASW